VLGEKDEVVRARFGPRMIVGKEELRGALVYTEEGMPEYTYVIHQWQSLDIK
jgi:hypothetical protein